ncbi:MAG: hypothetical protein E5W21_05505, partial [Mesorhizobium sp.]
WGSGAQYLFETIRHLDACGIRDRNLWQLQELVAQEILGADTATSSSRRGL